MPLYVADYLADTGHLSTLEHGAYLLLIMHYWQNGKLPTEEAKLARICRLSSREWAGVRDTLAEFFGDDWHHARIEQELCSAKAAYERRAKAGAKGGNAKAMLRQGQSDGSGDAGARPQQSQSQPHRLPSRDKNLPGEGRLSPGALAPAEPDPTAWDSNAPFGRTASGGGRP
ncbi:DUF1376 domain-containing protein [Methylobacterium sp. ap11]|uniref:YdaU family protein n=1 Tax=Methylobacterium sp. ap11 TaxID=1761799 RepID=UPI001FCE0C9C|nr:DUF1376 domain-containing protein [Methylobacterium sp. ap11]